MCSNSFFSSFKPLLNSDFFLITDHAYKYHLLSQEVRHLPIQLSKIPYFQLSKAARHWPFGLLGCLPRVWSFSWSYFAGRNLPLVWKTGAIPWQDQRKCSLSHFLSFFLFLRESLNIAAFIWKGQVTFPCRNTQQVLRECGYIKPYF